MASVLADQGIEGVRVGDFALRHFQVVGMRCSGTNYAEELVRENTSLLPSQHLGWKHSFPGPQSIPADLLVVVVVRDPATWIRSLYRKPWHFRSQDALTRFSQFLRSPVDTVMDPDQWTEELLRNAKLLPRAARAGNLFRYRFLPWFQAKARLSGRFVEKHAIPPATVDGVPLQYDRHPLSGLPFGNPVELRNHKLAAMLGYRNRACNYVGVRYELLRDEPRAFLAFLSDTFDVSIDKQFRPIDDWLGIPPHGFLREAPGEFSREDARFLAENLDLSLERRLGYEGTVKALMEQGARDEGNDDVGSARNAVR